MFVGTLEARKNILRLIEAWREVRKILRRRSGSGRPRSSRVSSALPKRGSAFLARSRTPIFRLLYSGALACVYPSFYEGFGLPVLEAMQCGAIVVASRDPAILEVSGAAAIHIDAGDTRALTEALAAVARAPEILLRFEPGPSPDAREFTWQSTARQTREVYDAARQPSSMDSALFLSPEAPIPGSGGGGLRSASLLEYLRRKYAVEVADFDLAGALQERLSAKLWRNSMRLAARGSTAV